jgi:hypothetical protein
MGNELGKGQVHIGIKMVLLLLLSFEECTLGGAHLATTVNEPQLLLL